MLLSRLYEANSEAPSCFEFWYHINGASNGKLRVWLKSENPNTVLWERDSSLGNMGDKWRYGHVTVRSPLSFQLVLEGLLQDSTRG